VVRLAHPAHAEGHGTDDLEIVSIPSEVGRGRAPSSWRITSIPCDSRFVAIPSEVGRGRALSSLAGPWPPTPISFNPLGGGAGSGSQQEILQTFSRSVSFVSIPSEVGRGRARISTWLASSAASEK